MQYASSATATEQLVLEAFVELELRVGMWSICRSHPRVGGKHNLCGAFHASSAATTAVLLLYYAAHENRHTQ